MTIRITGLRALGDRLTEARIRYTRPHLKCFGGWWYCATKPNPFRVGRGKTPREAYARWREMWDMAREAKTS